jgi:hypothetical protein
MYLLELAGQSVRGLSPALRVALKPGYVVLKPPGAESPPLATLISALLFPEGRGGDASFIAPGQRAGKAGLTLLGNDQNTYRLVRDLGGPGALHRLDRTTQKFVVVTEDANEMTQCVRSQVGAPPKSTFEQLFSLTTHQLPSRRPSKSRPAGTAISGPKPALSLARPVEATGDPAVAQRKLQELELELLLSKEIDQLQYRLDGVTSQVFEAESSVKGNEGLKAALAEAESAAAAAPSLESLGLPKDIISRCERYPQLVQRRDEALAKLGVGSDEFAAVEEVVSGAYVAPLQGDARFWAGIGAGVVALGVGVAMSGPLRYLTLLDIPAFGFAALVALKYVDDLQASQRTSRKGGMKEQREKKIRDTFEAEAQHVQQAMKALGVDTPGEAIEHLSRRPLLAEKADELRSQLQAAEADPAFAKAASQVAKLKHEQEAINQQLLEKGGGVRPSSDVEREIARVKESLRLARGGAPAGPTGPTAESPPSAGATPEDPSPTLLTLAADFLAQDVPTVVGGAKDRCSQYLVALSDRRFQAVDFDKEGLARVSAGGKWTPATALGVKDLDLLYLSLRLTLVERCSATAKVPFILEDAFGVLDEAKVPLVARMLKHVGTTTQVLHAAAAPAFDGMADLLVKV